MKKVRSLLLGVICICMLLGSVSNATTYYYDTDETTTVAASIIEGAYVTESNIVQITAGVKSDNNYDDDYDYFYYDYYDYDSEYNFDGYELYRGESEAGEYKLIAANEASNKSASIQVLDTEVEEGKTYFYKVRFRKLINSAYVYGEFSTPLCVTVVPSPGKIQSVRATKAKTFTIKWNTVSNVDGYDIYIKEFPNEILDELHDYSQYETEGIPAFDLVDKELSAELQKYKFNKIATITSSNTSSYKYKKAKHGYGYLVALKTYKMINGVKVTSSVTYNAHGVMDYYFCPNAENSKYIYKWPKTQKKANALCTTIKVKMWDFVNHSKHAGKKKTRIQYITVNKKYAETIKQIYKEIYINKTKPPIYEAGSYRWRKEESTWSYHTVGTAIDMNCNENPMYRYDGKKKKIVVGSFYKPKTNPYSIPRNGVIEKTFAKYGFNRLSNDLMHFNAGYVCSSSNYK